MSRRVHPDVTERQKDTCGRCHDLLTKKKKKLQRRGKVRQRVESSIGRDTESTRVPSNQKKKKSTWGGKNVEKASLR